MLSSLDRKSLPYILVFALGLVAIYVRWRYLHVPFERDEGEYAYGAQIILQGKELYSHVYSLKWPGIFLIYSILIGAFGASIWAVHFGLLLVNIVTAYIIYRVLVKIIPALPALMGATSFLIFMVQKELQGIFANIEHFVIFFIALALYKLFVYWDTNKLKDLTWAGIFCGLALVTKQQAIGFILAIGVGVLFKQYRDNPDWKGIIAKLTFFGIGLIAPVLVVFIWIALFDDFQRFWFHTWVYATEYVGIVSLDDGWTELKKRIIENFSINPGLWGLGLLSSLSISKTDVASHVKFLLIALFIGAFIATSFGLYFRPHYVMFMPLVMSLLIGVFLKLLYQLHNSVPLALFSIAAIFYGYNERIYLFNWTPDQVVGKVYHWEPFAATLAIGEHLREVSDPNDQILVIGSEPQINFYAGRNTPTGYVYAYPLVEDQPLADSMFNQWKDEIGDSPEYIVSMGEWTTYAKWSEGFYKLWGHSQDILTEGEYDLIGIININSDKSYSENWGEGLIIPEDIKGKLFIYQRPLH